MKETDSDLDVMHIDMLAHHQQKYAQCSLKLLKNKDAGKARP